MHTFIVKRKSFNENLKSIGNEVLIPGGTGFIGLTLFNKELLDLLVQITVIDNFSTRKARIFDCHTDMELAISGFHKIGSIILEPNNE